MQWINQYQLLITQLWRREIESRYRGSVLGLLWSLITPMMMLAVYTFVFQTIFKARWHDESGNTQLGFAIVLFLGLSLHGLLSETLVNAPRLILNHQNFVKKIVFPLEILPLVNLLSAIFAFAINMLLLIALILIESHHLSIYALYLPVILLPYLILLLGIGWILSALGVYLRDVQQIMGTLSTLLLFLSPIFYSTSVLPEAVRPWLAANPLTLIVESSRNALIYHKAPDLFSLGIYTLVAILVAVIGYQFFKRVRPGFADVL